MASLQLVISLFVSLITGAVAGNAVGALLKKFSLGLIGNTIAGLIGGGLGGELLSATASLPGSGWAVHVAASGVGGAVALLIGGAIKSAFFKQESAA